MTEAASLPKHQPRKPRRSKRPPLTHFLCFPLVNTASISQLESSLAAFKTTHIFQPGAASQQCPKDIADAPRLDLPAKAFRPLGTLHLTLGVMSLPTKERLHQAIDLFHSLDLAEMMREVDQGSKAAERGGAQYQPSPFAISLESLHALPRPKSATVLHASPVDPTHRLLPFCLKLRDKFIDAGFIQTEPQTKPTGKQDSNKDLTHSDTPYSQSKVHSDDSIARHEIGILPESSGFTETPGPSKIPPAQKPTPRPLLLHATLVNTIYVRGRHNPQSAKGKESTGKNIPKRITFDARNLVSQYRHYYSDDKGTVSRLLPSSSSSSSTDTKDGRQDRSQLISEESIEQLAPEHGTPISASLPQSPSYPFIWAKEIPLDTLCICEMGAKRLQPGVNDGYGLNERLGEQYTVVAERSLLPSPSCPLSEGEGDLPQRPL